MRTMSVSLKRPIESVDSPESQEDRNGRHIGIIEPAPSFEARYVIQYHNSSHGLPSLAPNINETQ